MHIQQLRGQKYIKEVVAKPGRRKETVVEEENQEQQDEQIDGQMKPFEPLGLSVCGCN